MNKLSYERQAPYREFNLIDILFKYLIEYFNNFLFKQISSRKTIEKLLNKKNLGIFDIIYFLIIKDIIGLDLQ